MNTDTLTNDTVRKYIPNVLTEVEGETLLSEKLSPFIDTARQWLERDFLGVDDFLSESHRELAMKIVVTKAFTMAVPSLDLMLTPTGFGVISSDNMVPASKERVERLVASLEDYVYANLVVLLSVCREYEAWRSSERGRYFCATFLCNLDDTRLIPDNPPYATLRNKALAVESVMADSYLGYGVMTALRDAYIKKDLKYSSLCNSVREAVVSIICKDLSAPIDSHPVWHRVRYIVNELNSFQELKAVWNEEMSGKFKNAAFVNDIKGGFYF